MTGRRTTGAPNTYGWAELNSRGVQKSIPSTRSCSAGATKERYVRGEYTEFQAGGESIAGGMEMNPMVPAEVPSYWMVYFNVDDVDKAFKKRTDGRRKGDAGARSFLAALRHPPGPQGANVRHPEA